METRGLPPSPFVLHPSKRQAVGRVPYSLDHDVTGMYLRPPSVEARATPFMSSITTDIDLSRTGQAATPSNQCTRYACRLQHIRFRSSMLAHTHNYCFFAARLSSSFRRGYPRGRLLLDVAESRTAPSAAQGQGELLGRAWAQLHMEPLRHMSSSGGTLWSSRSLSGSLMHALPLTGRSSSSPMRSRMER